MGRHKAALAVFAGSALGAAALAILAAGPGQAQPPRLSFQVATGATAGTYFPMGELIAGIVSHPPGLARCDARAVCGPSGLIVSARTSDGAVANVLAVEAGQVDSAFSQANVVADAVAGRGAFRKTGRLKHIRVIADLFPETIQLVAAAKSPIRKVADLSGKRVSVGTDGSGASVVAREILSAYRISERRLRLRHESYDVSADLLQQGKIDAFFFEGVTPSPLIHDLLARGAARLVPIDGKARRRLLLHVPDLYADTISAGLYPHTDAIGTVSSRTLWVVKDTASPDIVYGILRALFNPANRVLLDAGPPAGRYIRLDDAANGLTAPLHPGAERFYRETGKLPDPQPAQHH
ncbi:MAG: TAXI family TRAP transporter solute-binding subunit [Alphaproteobacteria bacterium]|nr:TAXI family TRAP transporter solute-binding subunit [Alphaproteobacteria bacterium]